ncbi:LysR family transcriptional regulator [Ochrobactrum sp. Q0168]|uniref:LysR family transcriptional regulator n=1 Tax=Ochrobactrum sp. Q0168 TaxID=2793241 RepID=UPI0018EB666D|nr:LysR family transcriptional regulator [Ochrobactrum sp. Q0168]
MNIRDLEAFVAVVETGSIVAASARIHLTQPGITRRIQTLEENLGVTLLHRQSKPLKPTIAGREAYEHGRRVLRSLEDLRSGVSPGGEIRGEFRLGLMPYLSQVALTNPLDQLRKDYPELTLRLGTGWSPSLLDQVLRSQLDAAAVCLPEGVRPPDELAADDLGGQDILIISSKALNVPRSCSLEDLARFSWVMNESGCGFRAYIRHRFERAHLPFDVAVEALSVDLRLSLVARGLGIGIVTPGPLATSSWRDQLEIIKPVDFSPRVNTWLVHRAPAGRLTSPIAVFREALVEALEQGRPFTG